MVWYGMVQCVVMMIDDTPDSDSKFRLEGEELNTLYRKIYRTVQ